ncbi:MAG TPA: hypothetical protein DDY98_06070 [Ruminococcaceae bacterium]|nr:hypothetical protein [Oscillospiraceae bacterium]
MTKRENLSAGMKVLSVILGTLAGGFLWRCRGESGFGSSWGLYSVGLILLLLVWQFYGRRQGMTYEKLLTGSFLTGLGVTGYATVLMQASGLLNSDLPYQGEVVDVTINPYSGLFIMLIMGMTFIPFYSFFVTSLFSDKKYRLRHYAVAAVIFFGVSALCKLTVAHPILSAINPEQVKWAALGLRDSGLHYTSPMKTYLSHFMNRSWTQDIPFFENYYMSIEHISDLFGVLAIDAYALFGRKDKVTCFASLIMQVFVGIATTAWTSLMLVSFDTGMLADVKAPRFLGESGWPLWEFATGASVGFITMLVLALLPKKYTKQTQQDTTPLTQKPMLNLVYNTLITVFILCLTPWRVIGLRIGKLLYHKEILADSSPTGDIIMIAGTVIMGVLMVRFLKKNLIDRRTTPLNIPPVSFSFVAFPAYFAMCVLAYFFLNRCPISQVPYAEMTSASNALYLLTGSEQIETFLMFLTFLLIVVLYVPVRKKLKNDFAA